MIFACKAGIPCEKEPRSVSTYTCLTCKSVFDFPSQQWHHKICGGKNLHRSGPDLVIYWNTGPIFYDLTIIHELAASNHMQKIPTLIRNAIQRKNEAYVQSGMFPHESFKCLPVLSGGALHENTRNLIRALADASQMERQVAEQSFKLKLQDINGAQVLSHLRQYLQNDVLDRKISL